MHHLSRRDRGAVRPLRFLVGSAPDTPLVYVLALLELVWLLSASAVILALVGLVGYWLGRAAGVLLVRAAGTRVGLRARIRSLARAGSAPAAASAAPGTAPPG